MEGQLSEVIISNEPIISSVDFGHESPAKEAGESIVILEHPVLEEASN